MSIYSNRMNKGWSDLENQTIPSKAVLRELILHLFKDLSHGSCIQGTGGVDWEIGRDAIIVTSHLGVQGDKFILNEAGCRGGVMILASREEELELLEGRR